MNWDNSYVCAIKHIGVVDMQEESGEIDKWVMSIEYHPFGYFKYEIKYYKVNEDGDITHITIDQSVNLERTFLNKEGKKTMIKFNDYILMLTNSQLGDIDKFFESLDV